MSTVFDTKPQAGQNLAEMSHKLEFQKKLQSVTNKIHATNNLDEIMLELSQDICALFAADRLTVYVVTEDRSTIISKVKTGLIWQEGYYCGCSVNISATTAPEAAFHQPGQQQRNLIGDWTIPLTNRILIDAGALLRSQDTVRIVPPGTNPAMISVTEQALGNFRYRMVETGPGVRPDVRYGPFVNLRYVRGAVSFIAGGHARRAGGKVRTPQSSSVATGPVAAVGPLVVV